MREMELKLLPNGETAKFRSCFDNICQKEGWGQEMSTHILGKLSDDLRRSGVRLSLVAESSLELVQNGGEVSRFWGEVVRCRCTLWPVLEQLVRFLQPGRRLSRLYHSHAINIIHQLCGRVVAVHYVYATERLQPPGQLHCLL